MKIEKITLCNLTSIEGEQIIDFSREPLRSARLFSITGEIATGVSTLFDAICLALYNRAPRFDDYEFLENGEKQLNGNTPLQTGRAEDILCRGQKEAYSKVEFVASDGNLYEACWFLRQKRMGADLNVTRTLRQLTPKKETYPEEEMDQKIVSVIGLDYLDFRRAVFLDQNKIFNFLKAEPEEKAALLEKLTGTEIYSKISRAIYGRYRDAKREYEALENKIKGIYSNRLDPEDVAAAEEKLRFLESNVESVIEQQETIDAQLDWYEENGQCEAEVSRCEAEYDAAHKAYVALRGDELDLERYDDVLCVQPLYQEIIVRKNDISALKIQEDSFTDQLEEARAKVEESRANLEGVLKRSAEAESRLVQRRPAINRGHVLNGEISEAQEALHKKEEEMRSAHRVLEQCQNQLSAKQEEYKTVEKKIEGYQLHQQALSVHKLMFERFDLIKDKLSLFNSESRLNAENHKKAVVLQKRQKELSLNRESIEKQQQVNLEKLSALKGELVIHVQTNRGHDSGLLQQRFADYRSRLIGLEHAGALWQRISVGFEEIDEKKATLSRHLSEQEQIKREINRIQREVEILDEAYRRLNVAFTLSQSENIVQLRQQLKEGSACPVCGATHHPYHTETERELGELLNNLEKEFTEAEEQLSSKENLLSDLRQKLAMGEGRILAETKSLEDRERQHRVDVEEWKTCEHLDGTFVDCTASVNRNARRLMIEMLLDNTRRAVGEAEQELNTFNFHQEQINQLNEEINALNIKITDDQSFLEDLRTQHKIVTASLDDLQHTLQLSDRTCSQLYTDLDEIVTLSGWFSEWKNNPDGFRMRLTNMYMDWQNTNKTLDECQRSAVILVEEIRSAETNRVDAMGQVTHLHEIFEQSAQSLRNKNQEFKDLFPENTPEKEEEILQQQINQARRKEADARTKAEEAAQCLSNLEGTQQNLVDNRLKKQEVYGKKMSELDLWILRFNGSHSPVQMQELGEIFTGGRNWNELRRQIDDHKKARTLALQNLEIARENLLKVQSSSVRPRLDNGESPDELKENRKALQQRLEQLHVQLSQVHLKLKAHEASIKLAASCDEHRTAVRENYEQWQQLNGLLGSADGTKYRNLAQTYLFGCLIDHANYHLSKLSPRYRLKAVTEDFTLEVVDRDRFGQSCEVHALRGGEIFVISLALAMGLSSFSIDHVAIGNLFIDEGQIHLDQQSFQLVMETLSRLETIEGRKVGLVCRTNQICSQIHPQVRFEKIVGTGMNRIVVK